MTRTLRHWRALLSIFIQDGLAYKVNALIWVLTDASTALIMPLVLGAAAKGGTIQGFSQSDFVLYYLTSILVTSFVTCHFMWEVSQEIKEGIFSCYLLRPISFLQYMAARNLAWRVVRTAVFVPLFLLILFAFQGMIRDPHLLVNWVSIAAVFFGHVLSFMLVMALSCLALFFQEATSIFELYYIPMLFLSGQMFPIALFPEWARAAAQFTPFYYTTGLPTELLIGRISMDQGLVLLGQQILWIAVCFVVYKILFKQGLKHYTGVGM